MGKRGRFNLIINFIVILGIMILGCKNIDIDNVEYTNIEVSVETEEYDRPRDISEAPIISDIYVLEKVEPKGYNKELSELEISEDDKYLLAKIAMAEAENQNIQTKTLVIMSVLNRVESSDFPDSISEVIYQKVKDVYQYSPLMPGGRWYKVEPNEDCYEALEVVLTAEVNYSGGALYFESCEETDNWHSKNLEFLYQSGDLRFYR